VRVPRFSPRLLSWRDPHSLAGAYALDALDGDQRTRFERHLSSCQTCPDEVRGFTATAAALGLAAAATPPPALKGRVLAEVAALDGARAVDAEIAGLLGAPDALVASAATSAGGTATVVASPRAAAVVFTSVGLPVLPPNSVYELWFIGAGGARPAGLVPPASRGMGEATAPVLAPGLSGGDAIGVTVEPAGGSTAPTTSPIVVLTLRA
jgi:anti-sigma-K factor RskA